MTDFPPPEGFAGYENTEWGNPGTAYERECTKEEVAILEADAAAALAAERTEEEALRDTWFETLKTELPTELNRHPGLEPGPAFTSAAEEENQSPPPGPATSGSAHE